MTDKSAVDALRREVLARTLYPAITDGTVDFTPERNPMEKAWGLANMLADALAAEEPAEGLRPEHNTASYWKALWETAMSTIDRQSRELAARPTPAREGLDPYTDPYTNRAEHERQSNGGTHHFDPQCPFCFFDRFDAERRAALAGDEQ